MYLYPSEPEPEISIVLKTGYNEVPEIGAMRIPILPTTPVGIVNYHLALDPGAEKDLDFKIPYQPVSLDNPLLQKLRDAQFDDYLNQTIDFWRKSLLGYCHFPARRESYPDL